MVEEEYEIMPHKTISNIKKELEDLKKRASSKEAISSESFIQSIDTLTQSINGLMNLFKEAAEDLKVEEETEKSINESIGPLIEKIDEIEEENRHIAQAVLAVANMIKERVPQNMMPEIEKAIHMKPQIPKPMVPPLQTQHMEPPRMAPMPEYKPVPSLHEEHDNFPPRGSPPRMSEHQGLSPIPPPRPLGMPEDFNSGMPPAPRPFPPMGMPPKKEPEKPKGIFGGLFNKK